MWSRVRLAAVLALGSAGLCPAATLEKLDLEELARRSTAVVVGRAGGARAERAGPLIFTVYRFTVERQWSGESIDAVDVSIPGGSFGGVVQRFGGAPRLERGAEYALFLWRGPSGRTQISGLSQGVFHLVRSDDGEALVRREPGANLMLTPGGTLRQGAAESVLMPLKELAARVQAATALGVGGP